MTWHMHAMPMGRDGVIGAVDHVNVGRPSALKPQQRAKVVLLIA
jgi:hypothetical protein